MKKSCVYCGRVHSIGYICPMSIKNENRDEKIRRFRDSKAWRVKRAEIQDRDLHMCRICLSAGDYRRRDTSVHHIVPLTANWSKRLDNSNLITLCDYHHELAERGKIPAECLRALAAIPPEGKP